MTAPAKVVLKNQRAGNGKQTASQAGGVGARRSAMGI
jgi:hypothetical protein